MKYLNTALLIALAAGLGINFYLDFKREKKAEEAAEVSITPAPEVSPIAPPPADPYYNEAVHHVGPATKISFNKNEHNFGKIKEGAMVRTVFTFTNTGKEPLVISNAIGSCGCTVPEWPKEPIPPGGKGEIKVEFNSAGKSGEQTKTVTVTSNTEPPTTVLTVKSTVEPK